MDPVTAVSTVGAAVGLARSTAAEKVVEAITAGIGGLVRPWQTRRVGKAEADVSVMRAQADLEIADLVHEVAGARLVQRERNLRQIVGAAIDRVADRPGGVATESVDPDWMAQFLSAAEDVSNAEMQSLWSRILAGEVARPLSFSRRTLATVRVLERAEAESFTRLCSLFWLVDDRRFLYFSPASVADDLEAAGLRTEALLHLEAIGLLVAAPSVVTSMYAFEPNSTAVLDYWSHRYEVSVASGHERINVGILLLTETGSELAQISGAQPNLEYERRVIATLERQHLVVRPLT